CPSLVLFGVADSHPQQRVGLLEGIEDGALGHLAIHVELDLAIDAGERAEMRGQGDANAHGRVCTSTATTEGRSRTMGAQLSPELAETYTCPPVVPKYTPHGSSES